MIDGKDIWPLMAGETEATSPHEAFYCYYGRELRAVRDRRWKLVLPASVSTASTASPAGATASPSTTSN